MMHPKWALRLLAAVLVSIPALAAKAPAKAAPAGPPSVTVEAGSGRVIQLAGPAANLFVADPKVAEARPASPTSVFVFGIAIGHTTVAAMDNAGHPVGVYQVTVLPSSAAAQQAGATIGRALPGETIQTHAVPDGVEISGHVATPADAEHAAAMARSFVGDKQFVANRLQVSEPIQVLLRVRIVEMSRTLTRDLGLNWQNLAGRIGNFATIGLATQFPLADLTSGAAAPVVASAAFRKTSVEAIVDALAQDQLVHILAEPNLTTMSGEPASFLVGGEFPVPVAQEQNTISVSFKQYGISLAFVPTVVGGDRINMHIRPEISQLTNQGAVQLTAGNNSIVIPALTVRRADTTVELGSGQSFAIAGLLSDNVTHSGNGVPFLGDMPGVGALFRSDSFQRQETELVILVTPYIVRPVSDPTALHTPADGWSPPNDLERILLLRQNGQSPAVPVAHITGDAGFIVQ
ncbi:type II and III secretion system protein family protein [Rhodopila sp.]|uniref:type II and III secretion system protein family protein n=1 Tax=Rhodopila sp. TaxID=2480087 RepID=UPI003D139F98